MNFGSLGHGVKALKFTELLIVGPNNSLLLLFPELLPTLQGFTQQNQCVFDHSVSDPTGVRIQPTGVCPTFFSFISRAHIFLPV
jgi:hypothetical protein